MSDDPPARSAAGPLTDTEGFWAWHTLLQAQARLTAVLDRELHALTGLALTTYEVLVTLRHAPSGRLRMQELAAAVLLSKSGTTRVVGLLEESGFVRRETPSDNRRTTYAMLTPEGVAKIESAMPVLFDLVHEHFGRHLSARDSATVVRILNRLPCLGSGRPQAQST